MTTGSFQPYDVPPAVLSGRFEATVVDPGSAPTEIVRAGQPWRVDLEWEITGLLVPSLAGTWHVQLDIDPSGGGVESQHPATPVARPLTPANGLYTEQFVMQNVLAPGNYELVANLTYTDAIGAPSPLGGFVKLGRVMVQG
ncbi:hypothetical protein GCM10009850_036050 [Nonomuraea monospora]|uniref:Uncharacterized protein n=1 Tax=Nonomuraea monospora TaxID=568818 RepID=A0ABP5P8U0_9ACTN